MINAGLIIMLFYYRINIHQAGWKLSIGVPHFKTYHVQIFQEQKTLLVLVTRYVSSEFWFFYVKSKNAQNIQVADRLVLQMVSLTQNL